MSQQQDEFDSTKWAAPSSSKYSGWIAGLSPVFALVAIFTAATVHDPETGKGLLNGIGKVFSGQVFTETQDNEVVPAPAPAAQP